MARLERNFMAFHSNICLENTFNYIRLHLIRCAYKLASLFSYDLLDIVCIISVKPFHSQNFTWKTGDHPSLTWFENTQNNRNLVIEKEWPFFINVFLECCCWATLSTCSLDLGWTTESNGAGAFRFSRSRKRCKQICDIFPRFFSFFACFFSPSWGEWYMPSYLTSAVGFGLEGRVVCSKDAFRSSIGQRRYSPPSVRGRQFIQAHVAWDRKKNHYWVIAPRKRRTSKCQDRDLFLHLKFVLLPSPPLAFHTNTLKPHWSALSFYTAPKFWVNNNFLKSETSASERTKMFITVNFWGGVRLTARLCDDFEYKCQGKESFYRSTIWLSKRRHLRAPHALILCCWNTARKRYT